MSPVARRRTLLLVLTVLLLLGATMVLTLIVVQQPIKECLPSDILYGVCEPPSALDVFARIGIAITVPFLVLLGIGFVVRTMFREATATEGRSSHRSSTSDMRSIGTRPARPARAPAISVFRRRAIASLPIIAIFASGSSPDIPARCRPGRQRRIRPHPGGTGTSCTTTTSGRTTSIRRASRTPRSKAWRRRSGNRSHAVPPSRRGRAHGGGPGRLLRAESDVDWAMVPAPRWLSSPWAPSPRASPMISRVR